MLINSVIFGRTHEHKRYEKTFVHHNYTKTLVIQS